MNSNNEQERKGEEEDPPQNNNQDDDDQLGSELSGASEDVPDEVTDVVNSANNLTSYARNYKSDVLKHKKSKVKYVF